MTAPSPGVTDSTEPPPATPSGRARRRRRFPPATSALVVAAALAVPFAWLNSLDQTDHARVDGHDEPVRQDGEALARADTLLDGRHFGTTPGPRARVHCPIDGQAIDVSPIKSRLHRPLLQGGPSVEKIYTCPVCGYAGTAADWTAARTLDGAERERLSRSLAAWARESPAARAALVHVDDAGEPTFVRALLAARLASTASERTRWLEVALSSADRVRPDEVEWARDGVMTGSAEDQWSLRAALRASVLLELGRTGEAQLPLGLLDRSSPDLSWQLRSRFGVRSLPGWW